MNKPCEACGGSGQISYFMGVSRFFITWEECPECGGLGFVPAEDKKEEKAEQESAAPPKKR